MTGKQGDRPFPGELATGPQGDDQIVAGTDMQQFWMPPGCQQHLGLQQEFQIDQATGTMLEVEPTGIAAVEAAPHLAPHA